MINKYFCNLSLKITVLEDFKKLGIKEDFIKGLNELNIVKPTQVQQEAIPLLLKGKTDIVAQAQTGTGKTAAYGLPLLHKIDSKKRGNSRAYSLPNKRT